MMERLDSDTVICEFDTVTECTVYIGFFSGLKNANDKLKWRTDTKMEKMTGFGKVLTLKEISDQLGKYGIITVFVSGPLDGTIYQYGNYTDRCWYNVGNFAGYW